MVGMNKFCSNESGSSYGRWALEEVLTSYILCRILEVASLLIGLYIALTFNAFNVPKVGLSISNDRIMLKNES